MNENIKQQNTTNKGMEYEPMLASVRPQDREIEGLLTFTHKITKESENYPKAFSIPMNRCEGCPLYKVDERTSPTGYYCQSDFVSSYNFSQAVKNKKVPDSCKIWQVEDVRKYAR